MMPEYLVLPACQVMMVGMPAEFKQHDPSNHMVTVPAVMRHGSFVNALTRLFSAQAIMFDIIDRLQQ